MSIYKIAILRLLSYKNNNEITLLMGFSANKAQGTRHYEAA